MSDALVRHGGTVEKFIGDAVMAVFGIPTVREDDALRAVRAAAEMRTALAELNEQLELRWGVRLRVRTGVNTGEVIAGDPSQGHGFVTGDAVNVAARLEQAAEDGEILIGEHTLELVRDAVQVEPVPPLDLKGKSEPVPAFRLIDVAGPAAALGPADRLAAGRARARAGPASGGLRAHGRRAKLRAGDRPGAGGDRASPGWRTEFADTLGGAGHGRGRPLPLLRRGPDLLAAARGRRGARGHRRRRQLRGGAGRHRAAAPGR